MKGEYIEVQIAFNKKNYEAIYNLLYLEGIENILEDEGSLKIYFDGNEKEKVKIIEKSLLEEKIIEKKDFISKKFEDKNWNDEWKKSIEPVYIRNKIIVHPSWKKNELKNADGKILIEIDPKMSFGTGHNETTQLLLELMSDYIKGEEELLLDYGCGTGILSIAGIKLGVNGAVAIDIDEDSIENAKEYLEANSVADNIKLIKAGIHQIEESDFDIICANIIRSVIIDNFEHINDKIRSGGKLFLSGFLNSEDQEILEYLIQNEFEVEDIQNKSEWIGIYAVKR